MEKHFSSTSEQNVLVQNPPFCWEKNVQNDLISDLIEYSSREITYIRVDDIETSKQIQFRWIKYLSGCTDIQYFINK